MTALRAAAAAILAALIPAAALAAAPPAVVELGGARAYVRADERAPLAHLELIVRAGLDREGDRQDGLAALVAQVLLRTPVEGVALEDAIAGAGGAITFAVTPQAIRIALDAPSDRMAAITPALARVLAAPAFDAAALSAARAALGERIADEQRDPRLVGIAMLRASRYRGGAGLSPLGSASALASLSPQDAGAFFARWYVRGGALVSSVGLSSAAAEAAGRQLIAAIPPGAAAPTPVTVRPFGAQPKRIVTHRDGLAVPSVVVGFAAPSFGERDFAPALVVRALLSDVLERDSSATLPVYRRTVATIYSFETTPSQLTVWINGAKVEPSTGLAALDAVLKRASVQLVNPDTLTRAKDEARGAWALDGQTTDARAWMTAIAVARGLDPGYSDGVGDAIAHVTAADVKRVAAAYFRKFDVALILPREAPQR